MTKFATFLIAATALTGAPALAQEAAPTTPAPQTAAPAAPTTPAAPATDAEVKSFAKAAIAADKISKDTTIAPADKGQQLASAVTNAGIQPERFNQIASASDSDPALQKRIQDAITAEQQASPAAAAAPAPAAPTPAQ